MGQATANQASDLMLCDYNNSGDEIEAFDLTVNIPEILGAQNPAAYSVTFYETQAEATIGSNAIVAQTAYLNTINPQTVYARVENVGNGDFDTTNFSLVVNNLPTAITPTPLEVCDDDYDGFAAFDLHSKSAEIVNGDPSPSVSYHETMADAENGTNMLSSPYANIVPYSQIIYARVENVNSSCFQIVQLELVVLPLPNPNDPFNLYVFDGDGDGFAVFDLTENDEILSDNIPSPNIFYFQTFADASNLTNYIVNTENYENSSNPEIIYTAVQNGNTGCFAIRNFLIATDGPGLTDTDNDGLPDVIEDVNNNGDLTDDDTDGDDLPNFQDTDDDGDGTLTAQEDYNNNGSPTDDDTNNNGIPDYLDEEVVLGTNSFLAQAVTLSPNPTQNKLSIIWNTTTTVEHISVHGLDGKLINTTPVLFGETNTVMDLSAVGSGIYFVKIVTQQGVLTKKVIKK